MDRSEESKKNLNYYREIFVSYEELIELPNDDCIRVNKTYFYYLMAIWGAKKNLLKIEQQSKIIQIFSKYEGIKRMQDFLKGYLCASRYFIMTVDEIRYLINTLGDYQISMTWLLKSDMKAFELENDYNILKEKFIEKKIHDKQLLLQKDYKWMENIKKRTSITKVKKH